jgi:ribonuclease HI
MEITIHCDGSSLRNPGPSGAGVVILLEDKPVAELSIFLGNRTNNEAEYLAVFYGAKFCLDNFAQTPFGLTLHIFTDSQLIIHQLREEWVVKQDNLRKAKERVMTKLRWFNEWNIKYRHWDDSEAPHRLAQHASKSQRDNWRWLENDHKPI